MLHTIQADFYQLVRSKGFWLTEGGLFLIAFASSFGDANFFLSVSGQESDIHQSWTGFESLHQVSHEFLPFVMISLLILITFLLGHDLTKKLYKNILACGVSRRKFYLYKIVELALLVFLQLVIVFAITFVFSWTFHGLGIMPDNFVWIFSTYFFRSFLFLMTCISMTTCLLYLSHSAFLSYLVFSVLILGYSTLTVFFPQLNSYFITLIILIGSIWIGYQAFQHRDL